MGIEAVSRKRDEGATRRVKRDGWRPTGSRMIDVDGVQEERLLRIDGEKCGGARRNRGRARQIGRWVRKDGCDR